jgi:hypothetical protein
MTMPPVFIAAVPWQPERAVAAVKLHNQIKADTGTEVTVTWDQDHDAYDTFVRNLEAAGQAEAGAVFMEDDVILTRDFGTKITAVIAEHPTDVIQFYSNRDADLTTGSRYESGRGFMNNQCWYAPPGLAPDLAAHLRAWPARLDGRDPTGYDLAMADHFKANRIRYWISVPSLVQHRDMRSVINSRRPHGVLRQSRTFQP